MKEGAGKQRKPVWSSPGLSILPPHNRPTTTACPSEAAVASMTSFASGVRSPRFRPSGRTCYRWPWAVSSFQIHLIICKMGSQPHSPSCGDSMKCTQPRGQEILTFIENSLFARNYCEFSERIVPFNSHSNLTSPVGKLRLTVTAARRGQARAQRPLCPRSPEPTRCLQSQGAS